MDGGAKMWSQKSIEHLLRITLQLVKAMARITIKCGDPKSSPATYTRFVMPFAYKAELICDADSECKSASNFFYEVVTKDNLEDFRWRQDYFTKETGDALFTRAIWLELHEAANASMSKAVSKRCFQLKFKQDEVHTLMMNPPVIVLFEAPYDSENNRMMPSGKADKDLMHVGFLLMDIYFSAPLDGRLNPSLDNLLELNELFRYRAPKHDKHEADELRPFFNIEEQQPLGIEPGNDSDKFTLFDYKPNGLLYGRNPSGIFARWEEYLRFPLKFTQKGNKDLETYRLLASTSTEDSGRKEWDVYADSRNFVWTCAIVDGSGNTLRREFYANGQKLDGHLYGHWIKLLNVDPPENDQIETHNSVRDFEREWAKERTYHRWEEWGTYYGFNYHSGALLAPPLLGNPLWKHFRQMYFDMVLLLFYLRVVLFRFSTELFEISAAARNGTLGDSEQIEDWSKKFQDLRWQFMLFTNLYQFPLISNQQQGVEMYGLARKYMDVDELYKEVQQEIHNSQEYLQQVQQQEQTQLTTLLTVVATVGLGLSIAFAFFSMKFIEETFDKWQFWGRPKPELLWLSGLLVATVFFFFLLIKRAEELAKRFSNWQRPKAKRK